MVKIKYIDGKFNEIEPGYLVIYGYLVSFWPKEQYAEVYNTHLEILWSLTFLSRQGSWVPLFTFIYCKV